MLTVFSLTASNVARAQHKATAHIAGQVVPAHWVVRVREPVSVWPCTDLPSRLKHGTRHVFR